MREQWNIPMYIRMGTLLVGDVLRNEAHGVSATIASNGMIDLDGTEFPSVSASALAAIRGTGKKQASQNGATFWTISRLGKTFKELGQPYFKKLKNAAAEKPETERRYYRRVTTDYVLACSEEEAKALDVTDACVVVEAV